LRFAHGPCGRGNDLPSALVFLYKSLEDYGLEKGARKTEMLMPSRFECIGILEKTGMPCHIRRHSLMVAEVALFLGRLLNGNGSKLDLNLVEAAALLHDIGKQQSLERGGDHAILGARMLEGIVHPAIARIVSEHIWLEPSHIAGPLTESLLVNYSDKRVKHEQVVSVEERYHDRIDGYAISR